MTTKDVLALALEAHKKLIRAYVNLLETGRDRIISHGGTCDSVEQMEARDPALREAREAITAIKQAQEPSFPLISLGYGRIEVAEGHHEDTHALIFGRSGTGQIGAPTQPEREHQPGETLAVVTFANVESLDVVAEKLRVLRQKITGVEQAQEPVERELIRRLYVELFHVNQQYTSVLDEDGEPIAYTGREVRDVLSDAKAFLEANPPAPKQAEPQIHCPEKLKKGGCQLHNLHCGWPKCNSAPTSPEAK